MKTAVVHARIEPAVKKTAEMILQRLGLSPTEAIRMFYTQIMLRNGLPFTVDLPNEKTQQALRDSRNGHNLECFESVDDLVSSWDE
jgi:DNA-damage-inducible protein J